MNNKFNFFVDCEVGGECNLSKAKKSKGDYPKELIIKGLASTNSKDSDGEELEPSGFELQRFLKSGFLNLEHKSKEDLKYIIGEPVKADIVNNELHIEGKLYKSNPIAVGVYDAIKMLSNEDTDRKIGLSIEGKALERDPFNEKRITKALITNCAITQSAKNQNTWTDIVKGEQSEDYVDFKPNGGQIYLLDITRPDGTKITVDKDFNIKVNKSMNTSSGSALIPESLGKKKKPKNLTDTFIKNLQIVSRGIEKGLIKSSDVDKVKKRIKYFLN